MEQSVDKAVSIDEWTGETLSSSMVDDVFYILRMCSYRALDTANLQALTAVLGQLNTLLATNLAQALDQRWKVPIGSSFLCECSWPACTRIPRSLLLQCMLACSSQASVLDSTMLHIPSMQWY